MMAELLAAQAQLEQAIDELARTGANTDEPRNGLQRIAQLQRDVNGASVASLAALRSDVTAALATVQQVTGQARNTAAFAETTSAAHLEAASVIARSEARTTMADMSKYDPYLQFSSPDEEDAYRQREAERRARVDAELAKKTPEGNLNAAGAAVGQMTDAGAHGAVNSPEFQKKWDSLVASTDRLRAQIVAQGGDVSKFDEQLRDDLRRIMKSKRLSDAEIDARFAAHPDNPLQAAKAYVADTKGIDQLSMDIVESKKMEAVAVVAPASPSSSTTEDAMATLKAAGVVVAEQSDPMPAQRITEKVPGGPRPARSI